MKILYKLKNLTKIRNERCHGKTARNENFSVNFSILITTLAAIALTACTEEFAEMNAPTHSDFDESDIVEFTVTPSTTAFTTAQTTRAEEPTDGATEIENDFEKTIDNIWVFQYHAGTKNLLIKPRYYTADKYAQYDDVNDVWNWTVVLKPDIESIVYVVTNVNFDTWAANYSGFMTPDDLLNATLPMPYTITDVSTTATQGHIPMQGYVQGTPTKGGTVTVPVERMYAKIKVRVIVDPLLEPYDVEINSLEIGSSPWYCRIGTIYDPNSDAESKDYEYPDDASSWVSRSMTTSTSTGSVTGNNTDDPNNDLLPEDEATYEYVVYIPENIQGETANLNEDTKADILPAGHPSRLDLRITYVDAYGVSDSKQYVVYPGGNNTNNFNIRRNQVYRVSMTLGYPIDPEIGSYANCYVTKPGKTISFEPYKNEGDGGGGYYYADYINPDEEDKRIDHIEILWQTYECIGDNSLGNLVYFVPSDPQTVNDKIYVTVANPGNAVLAAYNSSGTIIWSWHIWVSDEDPTNLSNAITYYTYDWDEDGIYGYGSGHAMIPGYALMTCNLGALSSYPENSTDVSTFGLNYQWGRKDPFPPLTVVHSRPQNYTEETTQPLYTNSHGRISGMTAEYDTSKLFYSMPGDETQNMADNGESALLFAIQHPTVYMAGTHKAATLPIEDSDTPVSSSSNYYNKGNWLPTPESEENEFCLWGGLVPDATTQKSYSISSSIHLYDDYGTKSIFDPCPPGWRVSPPDQWLGFTIDGKNPSVFTDINTVTDVENANFGYGMDMYIQAWKSGPTSHFPTPGPRVGNGCGIRQFSCGNYHNCTADLSGRVNILHMHDTVGNFKIFETGNYMYYVKCVASQIRCVRTEK